MRCLLVADLHYSLRQFDWVTSVAPDYDLVIIAGDFLDISSAVDRRAQIVVVRRYLRKLSQIAGLIVCSGNHDLDVQDETGERRSAWVEELRHVGVPKDGDSIMLGDTLISICPWWDGPRVKREIGVQLTKDSLRKFKRWIWVYHAPPGDSPVSWNGVKHYGDAELQRWIARFKPDLVLSGHIHQAPFSNGGSWVDRVGDTWVFNAGHQIGEVPAHVVFDTKEDKAMWSSLAGLQSVDLSKPLVRPVPDLTALPAWV